MRVTVLRVTRHGAKGTQLDPRVSWFVFAGENLPPLETIPAVYGRRYSIEHGFRVDKQDLLWEEARLRTPEGFQRWTDLVACVRNQLFLARDLAASRRGWERKEGVPTPSQVRRAMPAIIRQTPRLLQREAKGRQSHPGTEIQNPLQGKKQEQKDRRGCLNAKK